MDLKKFSANSMIYANGFDNIGFTCYFNSLIQALLSCTSFTETILEIDASQKLNRNSVQRAQFSDPLISALSTIIKNMKSSSQTDSKLGVACWKITMRQIQSQMPYAKRFTTGQQCVAEAYTILLQLLERYNSIQRLFTHRRNNKIYCPECQKIFSDVNETNNLFEVECDLKMSDGNITEQKSLNDYLMYQMSSVDVDCVCSLCKTKGVKTKSSKLTMVPEILFVMSKKYLYANSKGQKLDVQTEFPKKLVFAGKHRQDIIYEAVAQIEHTGELYSGHYWAICKRKNGWHYINDSSVLPREFSPSKNTYIVLYHVI